MILSPAGLDAVFAAGDETRASARLTGAQVAPEADVTAEKQSDAQWTAHPGQVDAHAMNRARTPRTSEHLTQSRDVNTVAEAKG